MVAMAPVLALFDPTKEVVVNVDARSHNLGAALLHDGKTYRVCSTNIEPNPKLVCSDREGNTCNTVWIDLIPPICIWQTSDCRD